MLHISRFLRHYKRADVAEKMLQIAQNREIGIRFEHSFGKRPDTLNFPGDIIEAVQNGAKSFHCSEEIWGNPMALDAGLSRTELDELRIGWDLVLDIDCAFFEYSRIAAELALNSLKDKGIECASVKFSGNKGFHIGVPFKCFPKTVGNTETKKMFPEAPRKIAAYIRDLIKQELSSRIMEHEGDIAKVVEKTGKQFSEITTARKIRGTVIRELNTEPFLEIDAILLSSRHLFRMPYSIHEKSSLVSTPLNPEKISRFKRENAALDTFKISEHDFLGIVNAQENEAANQATKLLIESIDYNTKTPLLIPGGGKSSISTYHTNQGSSDYGYDSADYGKLPEHLFPPCIKLIMNGLQDGKKRAAFILLKFLSSIGWNEEETKAFVIEWNKKNAEPLREQYLLGQIRYHFSSPKKTLPPNCSNEMYYIGIGVCKPDMLCRKIKNPVSYVKVKARDLNKDQSARIGRQNNGNNDKQGFRKQELTDIDLADDAADDIDITDTRY